MRKMSPALRSPAEVRPVARPAPPSPVERTLPAASALIEGFRTHGYRHAAINPLDEERELPLLAELNPRHYGLAIDDPRAYSLDFAGAARMLSPAELLVRLHLAYCGPIALDCSHVRAGEQRRWLYAKIEARSDAPDLEASASLAVLGQLAAAEAFEDFHRANFAGYKQFSMDGGESMVALLCAMLETAAGHGVETVVLGLPHRGRLNMMLNAFGVPAEQLLTLFSPTPDARLAAYDLKDHAATARRLDTASGGIGILLAHNPSHLESVCPVVCGMARALQDRGTGSGGVMPVLMHGDASFPAQGVVTETLNLSQTRGFGVGGTLHLVLNNQVGSTVSHPRDSRSTSSCADVARAIDAPIIHVNADDPEAVVFAARLATDYRMKFGADIVVDHVGYRRYGHFMRDDPMYTQPAMQRRIKARPGVLGIYADRLVRRGVAGKDDAERVKNAALQGLRDALARRVAATPPSAAARPTPQEAKSPVRTAMPIEQLRALTERLATAPADIALHPELDRMLDDWRRVARDDAQAVDWRLAENLAYGSLLANGFNVRLTGLDVGRGTFCHRQHVWHDQSAETDWQRLHIPLRHVATAQGLFSIFESPLSEEGVIGFEYGYSLHCGRDLVVWEAQFGDFVNNAQVIIDQYIASGESKWGYRSGLVALLPHGHDGWGPDHSCAYLGRFLQLAAGDNLRIVLPSTAAQIYHLLRRQALVEERRPLIVMTPKLPFYAVRPSYSRLADLASGRFQPLLEDSSDIDRAMVQRAIVTSGKLYYDLAQERARMGLANLPLLRVEELYPFPTEDLASALARFPNLHEVVWAQEEAKNHGAWHLVRDQIEAARPRAATLRYAGRPASAATAAGSAAVHAEEQREIAAAALASA